MIGITFDRIGVITISFMECANSYKTINMLNFKRHFSVKDSSLFRLSITNGVINRMINWSKKSSEIIYRETTKEEVLEKEGKKLSEKD